MGSHHLPWKFKVVMLPWWPCLLPWAACISCDLSVPPIGCLFTPIGMVPAPVCSLSLSQPLISVHEFMAAMGELCITSLPVTGEPQALCWDPHVPISNSLFRGMETRDLFLGSQTIGGKLSSSHHQFKLPPNVIWFALRLFLTYPSACRVFTPQNRRDSDESVSSWLWVKADPKSSQPQNLVLSKTWFSHENTFFALSFTIVFWALEVEMFICNFSFVLPSG